MIGLAFMASADAKYSTYVHTLPGGRTMPCVKSTPVLSVFFIHLILTMWKLIECSCHFYLLKPSIFSHILLYTDGDARASFIGLHIFTE